MATSRTLGWRTVSDERDGQDLPYRTHSFEPADNLLDALSAAVWAFEQLASAHDLARQATAFDRLNNAMSDLATYHPRWNLDTGQIEDDDVE